MICKKKSVFYTLDLYKLCREPILSELQNLAGFMIGRHNLYTVRCADDTGTDMKLREFLEKEEKKRE